MIDLDAYFGRINYTGSRAPTLETLHALAAAHVQTIPFENIDVLLGRPIDLEPAALEKKLVHARRGGYCFEQNGLMLAVLQTMGYRAQPISARVRYQRPREFTPPRTHLFVRVELDESWLVDVGVGAMSSTAALRLDDEGEQATPHEPRRLLRENGLIYHQVKLAGEWQDVNEFTLEEMPMTDRVVASWFTSTHPQSHFRNRLLVARAAPDGARIGLLNTELSIRDRNGHAEKRTIATQDKLLSVLREHFALELPSGTKITWDGASW
ncbi:N-hydroxyarylamine O-acetyltransferase [soil metagenome]